jgi:hypothetical protein
MRRPCSADCPTRGGNLVESSIGVAANQGSAQSRHCAFMPPQARNRGRKRPQAHLAGLSSNQTKKCRALLRRIEQVSRTIPLKELAT